MFGKLTDRQREIVAEVVLGREVADLGAGLGALARELIVLGAVKVIAIDKPTPTPWLNHPQIEEPTRWFSDVKETYETVLVSWPNQYGVEGLRRIVERASTVIYLGKNTDGTACGPADLWKHLIKRPVLHHEPDRRNTLIVYGEGHAERPLLHEEFCALDQLNHHTYESMFAYQREGQHARGSERGAED